MGKATTALDLARLHRAVWLASGGLGPLVRPGTGISPAEARGKAKIPENFPG